MHLLPTCLARLADHAGERKAMQMNCVRVAVADDNSFTAEATDARSLIKVSGPCQASAAEFPDLPAFAIAPNSSSFGLIPPEMWKRIFAGAAARSNRKRGRLPRALHSVAVKIGPNVATFASSDGESPQVQATPLVPGFFPPVSWVIDRQQQPTDRVIIEPRRLAALLQTVAAIAGSDARVVMETRGAKPLTIVAEDEGGRRCVGMMIPVARDDGPRINYVGANATESELRELLAASEARIEQLESELAVLRSDRGTAATMKRTVGEKVAAVHRYRAEHPQAGVNEIAKALKLSWTFTDKTLHPDQYDAEGRNKLK